MPKTMEQETWKEDPLREARGCMNGLLVAALIWAILIGAWWIERHTT